MLKEHVAHEPHVRWECRSAEYSQNTALFPLVDLFQRLWQFKPMRLLTRNWGNSHMRSASIDYLWRNLYRCLRLCFHFRCLKITILRSTCHRSGNAKRRWKLLSPSSWNLLSNTLCSLSWKTCTGPTHRPWSCLLSCLTRHQRLRSWCCSRVVRIFNLPGSPFLSHRNHRNRLSPTRVEQIVHRHDRWAKPSQQTCSSRLLTRPMACPYLSRKSRKPFLNQDSSKPSMGTMNSQGLSPRSPFPPPSKIRSWHGWIVWSPQKPLPN